MCAYCDVVTDRNTQVGGAGEAVVLSKTLNFSGGFVWGSSVTVKSLQSGAKINDGDPED